MDENQLSIDFTPFPEFKVGCRVDGLIQQYKVPADNWRDAYRAVARGVEGVTVVMVRVQ